MINTEKGKNTCGLLNRNDKETTFMQNAFAANHRKIYQSAILPKERPFFLKIGVMNRLFH